VREIFWPGAGEVSQILAGRKDGCRSERAVQNGRRLQGQGRGERGERGGEVSRRRWTGSGVVVKARGCCG
jgi:hypothetical protein